MMPPINDQLMAGTGDDSGAVSTKMANTVKCVACAVILCFAEFTAPRSLSHYPVAVSA